MISGCRKCSACGGTEFHIIPAESWKPTHWECERCGRIQSDHGEILVQGNSVAGGNV